MTENQINHLAQARTRGEVRVESQTIAVGIARWWASIDRWLLAYVLVLALLGLLIQFGISPILGKKFSLAPYTFAAKHTLFLSVSLVIALVIAGSNRSILVRYAGFLLLLAGITTIVILLTAEPYYGARRWLSFGLFTIQPSEFMKPAFTLIAAAMFARYLQADRNNMWLLALIALYAILATLLFLQPDIGQLLLITFSLLSMWFVAGMSFFVMLAWLAAVPLAAIMLYKTLPHVAGRLDAFIKTASQSEAVHGDQVHMGLELLRQGGMFGKGLGIGKAARRMFDPQSDFVFIAIGEQLGIVIALVVVILYACIVWRVIMRVHSINLPFTLLATTGLLTQIVCQAAINIASTLAMIPPKGTTLPWISAGGSSLLALGITLGSLLCLTRYNNERALV